MNKFDGEITKMGKDWFIDMLDNIPARGKLDLYLNTPGGDIFAGGEMVNACRKAMVERGVKVCLELGSCVASMGASLVAAVKASGGKVVAHNNTALMFHGCYGDVFGGSQELTDQAKAMLIFNESVQRDLAAIGIEDTAEWFAAGRQMWIGAPEALELKLVDEIYETAAEAPADIKVVADRLAAKLISKKENTMNEIVIMAEEKPVEAAPVADEVKETPEAVAEAVQEAVEAADANGEANVTPSESSTPEAVPEAPVEAPKDEEVKPVADMVARADFQAMQGIKDKEISNLKTEIQNLTEELSARKAVEITLKGDFEKAVKDLDDYRKEVADKLEAKEAEIQALKDKHEEAIAPAFAHHEPVKMTAKDIAGAHMTAEDKVKALLRK